jgi:hypothetical protein
LRRSFVAIELPEPITRYFNADRTDSAKVASCFTDDAVVRDEEQTHTGRDAIQRWKERATAQYQYTSEPIACEDENGTTVVTSRLTGNFPGSPVDVRYFFSLVGDKIASLEIV